MFSHIKSHILSMLMLSALLIIESCSSNKFLSENQSILTSVSLKSDDSGVDASKYGLYVRQQPNTKWFNLIKVPLGFYCLAGTDTTKRSNRFWRRLGEAPVIFSQQQTDNSLNAIALALKDKGYLQASVSATTISTHSNKKTRLQYLLHPGQQYIITDIQYKIDNTRIDSLIRSNISSSFLYNGMPCDASLLDKERARITTMLHNNGYYRMLKNYIHYEVDTLSGPKQLTLYLYCDALSISGDSNIYNKYHLRNINVDVQSISPNSPNDSVSISSNGLNIKYLSSKHKSLRPSMLAAKTHLKQNDIYRESNIEKTYRAFGNLDVVNYASISLQQVDSTTLDANMQILTHKTNSFGVELEGTNTAGNLGAAVNLTYTNRNLFRGSEKWTTKLKGAYEAITGLEGYSDQNYIEIGIETKLSFPKLIAPFRLFGKHQGTTNLSLQFDTQERPEFHRRVVTALWNYQWLSQNGRLRRRLDLPSLNYVYMPWISQTFRRDYLQSDSYRSALIRYAYEDLLILNVAYSHILNAGTNTAGSTRNRPLRNKHSSNYQLAWSIESAGNLLYALAKPLGLNKDNNDQYKIFDVAFAQYIKFDLDYSRSILLNSRNSLAMHAAFGIAQPYGNSKIVPFEKRYFGGGANGVRGWSVRELGPGNYMGQDGKVDFINQTGNLKLLLSMELRSTLFWKISGAAFIDAGNIWTTREYDATGEGGQFKFDDFYKHLAASYGLGIRLNLDYFILRFDMAMKAINPAYEPSNKLYLPILRPRFSRDFTFHFAVGLPF